MIMMIITIIAIERWPANIVDSAEWSHDRATLDGDSSGQAFKDIQNVLFVRTQSGKGYVGTACQSLRDLARMTLWTRFS
jgi:hypothetical protein